MPTYEMKGEMEFLDKRIDGQIAQQPAGSLQLAIKTVARTAAMSLAAVALTFSPARIANANDVAQLLETGACQGCDLSGADLTGAHLIGADLRDTNLTDAQLSYSNLEGADLTGAALVNTDLTGAFLTNAVLDEAVVQSVDFSHATLVYTSMNGATVSDVTLVGANVLLTPISVGGSVE